ncbi:MAG: N-acetyl-gamma-glutamyl-phosphate reductase [Treponema sp.]|nr:N-acetyl-gamma-glutamyl-phosphate reductase [Treponema sp.]
MIAGIIGAAGYAGSELVRLLAGHPRIDRLVLGSVSRGGERIEEIYPNFWGKISAPLVSPGEVIAAAVQSGGVHAGVVFAALPHGVGEPYAKACVEQGVSFIDLSADFRFGDDEAAYTAWYGKAYQYPELRRRSVYGLPELYRNRIRELAAAGPVIIGNPGCYPTAASLGIFPALARGLAALDGAGPGIIVDAASGISGGGREPARAYHFPECADSVSPYKIGEHRHTPEISRNLGAMRPLTAAGLGPVKPGSPVPVIFTPHLVPMNRGILSTIYIPLAGAWKSAGMDSVQPQPEETGEKLQEIRKIYAEFYRDEPFVRVLPAGTVAATGRVRHSNFCDISVHADRRGTTLIVISAIDNMVKGAAGQAVQNMNILLGFEESDGLGAIPALF